MCANYVVFFQCLAVITFSDNPYFDLSNGHVKVMIKNVIRKNLSYFHASLLSYNEQVWCGISVKYSFIQVYAFWIVVHTMGEFGITIKDRACVRILPAACDIQILRLEAVWKFINQIISCLFSNLLSRATNITVTVKFWHTMIILVNVTLLTHANFEPTLP